MKTERANFIEETYNRLTEAHSEIRFNELTDFESDRAEKLINFCIIMCQQFKDDERFLELFEPRGGEPQTAADLIENLLRKRGIK